ncbi:MAG: hypothetical protein Q8O53_01265 [Candidatus Moranbacteria bacterium]|nr:hypothetical protein [Candidatus Moranbacteria bacterium]
MVRQEPVDEEAEEPTETEELSEEERAKQFELIKSAISRSS